MNTALWFLLTRSLRGRLVQRLRRLRQPKYLLGAAVGSFWILFWVARPLMRGNVHFGGADFFQVDAPMLAAAQLGMSVAIAAVLTIWWLVPFGRPALQFSETELHMLLPAPVSRRSIVQYGVLRSQPGVLIGTSIMTFFWARGGPLQVVATAVSLWMAFSTWELHSTARSLWLARQRELPRADAWRRRLVLAGLLTLFWLLAGVVLATLASGLLAALPDGMTSFDTTTAALRAGNVAERVAGLAADARSGVLGWALTPLLILTGPLFVAPEAGPMAAAVAMFAAFLLLAAHNEWVVRSRARFEEAALDRAKRENRSAQLAARFWRRSRRGRERVPFPLAATGAPEIAILWKNLALTRRFDWRLQLAFAALAGITLVAVSNAPGMPEWIGGLMGGAGLATLVFPTLTAGRAQRNDLRCDLLKVELLRPWPVVGWRLFAAEVGAPVASAMLNSSLGVAILLAWSLATDLGFAGAAGPRQAAAEVLAIAPALLVPVGIIALLPPLAAVALLSSCLENLQALVLPSWTALGLAKKSAAANFGQHILTFFMHSLAMLAGLAPAVLLVGSILAVQVLFWQLPLIAWELPVLGFLGAASILAVCAALIRAGGRLWNRLDPSEELLSGRSV